MARAKRNNTVATVEALAANSFEDMPLAVLAAEAAADSVAPPVLLALPSPAMVEANGGQAPATRVSKIAPIADRPQRNGVRRPSPQGLCGAVWAYLDEQWQAGANPVPMPKGVAAWAASQGYNTTNATIELYAWRKFNGISGRQAKPVVEAPTEAVA